MKIYFAGSIRGGRDLQPVYFKITDHLEESGHTVLTNHVASKSVLEIETGLSSREIYERDIEWLEKCELFIADVTVPSLGVGFEVASAVNRQKPVLCIHQEGVELSAMIAGNSSKNIQVKEYKDDQSMINIIDEFINVHTSGSTGRKDEK
jgi:nucleoside 2-deoxyribosyltransferase